MEKVSFELEAVTPMFMSGADPMTGPPEFRAPSIKGLLRFWYRAIYPDYDPAEEDRLFGSTDHRSPFIVRGRVISKEEEKRKNSDWANLPPIAYMGYGPVQRNAVRDYFDAGTTFSVDFCFRKTMSEENKVKIFRAFWALCMFGGLGSRSRRGFGSVKVTSLSQLNALADQLPPFCFNDKEKFKKSIKDFINLIPRKSDLPRYTAFSNKSQVILTTSSQPHGIMALKELGEHFQNFRSLKTKKLFEKDYKFMLNFLKGEPGPPTAPLRSAFGLPHNYYFSNSIGTWKLNRKSIEKLKKSIPEEILNKLVKLETIPPCSKNECVEMLGKQMSEDLSKYEREIKKVWRGMSAGITYLEGGSRIGRRASPVLFHIQGFMNGSVCGVVTFLPAQLIPDGEKLYVSGNQKSDYVDPPDFQAVEDFFDYMVNKKGICEKII